MNLQAGSPKRDKSKSYWLIFLIYLILIFSLEPLIRESLFNLSIPIIENLQGVDPKNNKILKLAEFISLLGNTGTFIPIILLVYNYANIFKSFVLMMTLLFSTMIISILKMIYLSPRPYWMSDKILPFGCEGGWGNPSGHSIASCAFYLTLWHISFDCSRLRHKKNAKNITLGLTSILILLIMLSRTFVGAHSFNQIIFGCLLGLSIYLFLFYVLCIKVNEPKNLLSFLEMRNSIYACGNFLIFLFAFILFHFNRSEENLANWDVIISAQGCPDVPVNKRLQNEAFIALGVFLGNLGAFIGLKMEYFGTFTENIHNWKQYNFEVDERRDDESLMTKISINKETQWNHTNSFFSIMRLIVVASLSVIILSPFFFINYDQNIYIVFVFKLVIPINLLTFSMFYFFKLVLRKLRLVNMTLYSMLQDCL